MQSLTIKKATKFEIELPLSISNEMNEIGTISPDNPKTITVESRVLKVYNATFIETINESIFILNDDDELQAYNEYKKSEAFKIYYDATDKVLYSTAPSSISKNFLKALEGMQPDKIQIHPFNFDFQKIQTKLNSTRGISFITEDEGVQKKRFTGNNVDANQEAGDALNDETATFLIGKMDVLNKERTVGFTKAGALLMYSSLKDITNENPFLNVARAIIKIIK
ncbi:hypothetical protein CUM63_13045 [Enterococcus faecium]|jgi:hypothetical protein|uniref:hypothetical protein n=1 Tax=Bacteria TaxID=2 RepID=UPI0002A2144B|nr:MULTISPECIES: hypothetical protein [Bacteria]DAO87308.1 MAG TPA: hypothetical protein [Caudoviricetes sp.]EGP5215536.1 hypothetical protein [Enterococcus faecium]ELB46327.1 hypothetical protein OKE_03971 [Enterococcus faecium EnGen0043]EME8234727.1 hypothetical protein [Enterococcus faecium]EMF0589532.1 hypothetical protein [Enterococcus faecium]